MFTQSNLEPLGLLTGVEIFSLVKIIWECRPLSNYPTAAELMDQEKKGKKTSPGRQNEHDRHLCIRSIFIFNTDTDWLFWWKICLAKEPRRELTHRKTTHISRYVKNTEEDYILWKYDLKFSDLSQYSEGNCEKVRGWKWFTHSSHFSLLTVEISMPKTMV